MSYTDPAPTSKPARNSLMLLEEADSLYPPSLADLELGVGAWSVYHTQPHWNSPMLLEEADSVYPPSLAGLALVRLATLFTCWTSAADLEDVVDDWEGLGTPGSRLAHQLLTSLAMENIPFLASVAPPINWKQKAIRYRPSFRRVHLMDRGKAG